MSELWARLSRFGFAAFFLGLMMFAIGLTQGIDPLWQIGIAIPAVIIVIVIGRAFRDAYWPKRPVTSNSSRKTTVRGDTVVADRADDI